MDILALERSLVALQELFKDLEKSAESRFLKLSAEIDLHVKEKEEAINEIATLKRKLEAAQCELSDSREELELVLLQLHQMQEDLDYCYFLNSEKSEILSASERLNNRSLSVLIEQMCGR